MIARDVCIEHIETDQAIPEERISELDELLADMIFSAWLKAKGLK